MELLLLSLNSLGTDLGFSILKAASVIENIQMLNRDIMPTEAIKWHIDQVKY